MERELINTILDFYKKSKVSESSMYDENNCEFMILFPIKKEEDDESNEGRSFRI